MYFKVKVFDYYKVCKDYKDLMLCIGYKGQCIVKLIVFVQDYFFDLWGFGFILWIGKECEQCEFYC